jgi:pimeloyl-ACP methyl ester carboxylesterase
MQVFMFICSGSGFKSVAKDLARLFSYECLRGCWDRQCLEISFGLGRKNLANGVTWQRFYWLLLPVLLVLSTAGCGTFMAHRMVQSPNTYPDWFAPEAPVLLGFSPKFLTNFPKQFVAVRPPMAHLCYRIVEPADYHLKVSSTNWLEHGRKRTEFDFHADLPGQSNIWTSASRGTVVLLHGYGLAQFSMAPWALRLAQEGWQCVLVDLRGHGESTGRQIYYGIQEVHDLSQLLDELARDGRLKEPVAAFGESYGAVMALRWKMVEPRVRSVVAIAPYAGLSNAVMNLRHEYAVWLPKTFVKAGLKQLPSVLDIPADELDTTTELARHPVSALFVAGTEDKITPLADVEQLRALAAPISELIVVPDATHETVTYYMADLAPPVLAWLPNKVGQGEFVDSFVGTNAPISSQ